MAAALAIDERLLEEGLKVSGHKSKTEMVNEALREYVQRQMQTNILSLLGNVEFEPNYDYKQQRKRR